MFVFPGNIAHVAATGRCLAGDIGPRRKYENIAWPYYHPALTGGLCSKIPDQKIRRLFIYVVTTQPVSLFLHHDRRTLLLRAEILKTKCLQN